MGHLLDFVFILSLKLMKTKELLATYSKQMSCSLFRRRFLGALTFCSAPGTVAGSLLIVASPEFPVKVVRHIGALSLWKGVLQIASIGGFLSALLADRTPRLTSRAAFRGFAAGLLGRHRTLRVTAERSGRKI